MRGLIISASEEAAAAEGVPRSLDLEVSLCDRIGLIDRVSSSELPLCGVAEPPA